MDKFVFKIDGQSYAVAVEELGDNKAKVEVNGKSVTVEIEQSSSPVVSRPLAGSRPSACAAAPTSRKVVSGLVESQLPGNVVKIMVSVGQSVKRGDVLLTLESMKMENSILAEYDAVVKNIRVQTGQSVLQGDVLVELESLCVAEAPAPKPVAKPASAPKAAVESSPAATKPAVSAGVTESPLPGSVIKVLVKVGDTVKRGDIVLTMESMKMENNIPAARDGKVKNLFVTPGQSVMQGDALFELE